jgi:hypothetical protein
MVSAPGVSFSEEKEQVYADSLAWICFSPGIEALDYSAHLEVNVSNLPESRQT